MADKLVDIVSDPVEWAARHPGCEVPTGKIMQADFRPTTSALSGSPWLECFTCGFVAPKTSLSEINGRHYCPDCAVDAQEKMNAAR